MAATVIENKKGTPGRKIYKNKPLPEKFSGLNTTEKLEAIAMYIRNCDKENRIRRNQVYYLMALYYQGYQQVEMVPGSTAFDVYEREDFYIENQFRHQVDAVVNALSKTEGETVVRPASQSPRDITKARVAGPVLDMQKGEIGYDSMKTMKGLYKALFGNAFVFVDYVRDDKYGSIVTPKFKYEEVADEMGGDPFMSKVPDGFSKVSRGKEVGVVCSPLEVSVPADTKGFANVPWLQWKSRQPSELLNYMYPGLGASGSMSGSGDDDLSQHYLDVLGNLPGAILGDAQVTTAANNQIRSNEYIRTWITPCMFCGDKELERKFPNGVHVVLVDGQCVDYYEENLFDHWTHEVLLVNPHSLLGDGLYDALLLQDIINEANSLILKHTRYATVGHKGFDATMIDPKLMKNDPANGWVPITPTLDKSAKDAFTDIRPNPLSSDVPNWLQMKMSSMQDMTSAMDPSVGKSMGANTPYSQSVFLTERAEGRWKGSADYNAPALVKFHYNLLGLTKEWTEPRSAAVIANTGAYSFQEFTQADLAGEVDIILSKTDMKPKGRAEQVQALTMLQQMAPLIPTLSPKQKLSVEEILGLAIDSNPMNTQISRAYRIIDRIVKGEDYVPLLFVDDPMAQVPVIWDFLASEEGDDLALKDMEARARVFTYGMALMTQLQQQQGIIQPGVQPGPDGQPAQGGQQGGVPGGQQGNPGNKNGGPSAPGEAQSPKPAPPVAPPAA